MFRAGQLEENPGAIAELLGCDPATVRRWIHRYNTHGVAGLADLPARAGL
jgi:transposase